MPNSLTDIEGVLVGHATDEQAATGCTVVLLPEGTTGGVDVRGGAASTRGTLTLDPGNVVEHVDALVLTGGSAFGLDAVCGVIDWLEERGRGFDVGVTRVPIVAGAVLFDLAVGAPRVRPDKAMGRAVCDAASASPPAEGNVGAGTGASVGKLYGVQYACKGGVGSASVKLGEGVTVGALVAVNAFGDVIDPATGEIVAGARDPATGRFANTTARMKSGTHRPSFGTPATNTVIGVVATDDALTKVEANRVALMAQDGLARAVRPAHTLFDGDTLFAAATGRLPGDVNTIGAAAAEMVQEAILRAVRAAASLHGVPNGGEILQGQGLHH